MRQIMVRLSDEKLAKLKESAKRDCRSVNSLINVLLQKHLSKSDKQLPIA